MNIEARSDVPIASSILETALLMRTIGLSDARAVAAAGVAKHRELQMAIDEPNLRDLRESFGTVPEGPDETSFEEAVERAMSFLIAGSGTVQPGS